jgi:hypothetical protein
MEELIFFAVIIAFSILESISRSRKAKARGGAKLPTPEEWRMEADAAKARDELPTYDAEPSYDDAVRDRPLPRYTQPHGTATAAPPPRPSTPSPPPPPTGAELAADIWAEIAGLAGAKSRPPEPKKVSVPRQSPPLPPKPPPTVTGRRKGTVTMPSERSAPKEHFVHASHAGYGTDPSERKPSEQDGMDPLAERLGRDPTVIRAQLLSADAHQLRQAIILQEVLGPPAALREDRFEGWDLGLGFDGG